MTEFKINTNNSPLEDYNENEKNILQAMEEAFTDKLITENPELVRTMLTLFMIQGVLNAQIGGELVTLLKDNNITIESQRLTHMRGIDYYLTSSIDNSYSLIDELLEEISEPKTNKE